MWENAYLSIKNPKASLSGPWTPAANCSLRSRNSALLRRQLSASAPGAPPWPNPGSVPDACMSYVLLLLQLIAQVIQIIFVTYVTYVVHVTHAMVSLPCTGRPWIWKKSIRILIPKRFQICKSLWALYIT